LSLAPRTQSFNTYKNESIKLKALSDIASIDVSLEFGHILNLILKITCESMNAHSGTIMLLNEVTKQLEMEASYGLPYNYIERVNELAKKFGMAISTSPSGIVLETGKYYLVRNVFEETRDKPWMELARELGFSSQIFSPIKKGSKVIGLLNVYNANVHDFSDEEIDFVNIAASQATSVVQNARMCSRLKKNILELKDYEQHLQEKIKESHNKLFESEAKFHELFDNANDCIYTIDLEGKFLSANNAVAKSMKCTSVEEVLASNISKWMTPESLEKANKFMQEILSEEDYFNKSVIIEIIRKDGKHVWFEHKARPLKDENNNIIGLHGIGRDITENIKLKQELKQSNKQRKLLCNLIEGSRGGKTRAKILKNLIGKSYNAHQLAKALDLDYKTIRHHLDVLARYDIIYRENSGNTTLYSISKNSEYNINEIYL
jgi:PAS domain S-box-containing protein